MSLSKIVLQLARNPGLPAGDASQGYTLVAPLTSEGQIDLDAWRAHRAECRVVRFSPDPDEHATGLLTHRGSRWFFHYDEDDEGCEDDDCEIKQTLIRKPSATVQNGAKAI